MCIDTDLFDDVIVTVNDVNLWLDIEARMLGNTHSRREHYAETFDVTNKIKQSKLDGSFICLLYVSAMSIN